MAIPRCFMINYIDDTTEKHINCEHCKKNIGFYAENPQIVYLANYRECELFHEATLPDLTLGVPHYFSISKLSEIDFPNISLMNVSDINFTSDNEEGSSAPPSYCGLSPPFKPPDSPAFNYLDMSPEKSEPKRDTVADIIEDVVHGCDIIARPTRVKLEFVQLPLKEIFIDGDSSDLAILLPGEKMPEFRY